MSQRPTKGQEGTIAIEGHFLNGAKVSFQHENDDGSFVIKLLESCGAVFREGHYLSIEPNQWAPMTLNEKG
jgi:hypothetical protein